MPPLILLGPQRSQPTVAEEIDRLALDGPVAAVTAGWQEREAEDEELEAHLGRPVIDLQLYSRAERVFEQDPELFTGLRKRQNELRELQRLYRYRLDYALEPARELLASTTESPFLDDERRAAVAALRQLDAQHLDRVQQVQARYLEAWPTADRRAVRRQRLQLEKLLSGCSALLIAGGHVAILINRLRLFGLMELASHLPLIAWSAGAMALTERIVLFHDSPPQGAGNAEILDGGLGIVKGLVVMPHARRRMQLDDPSRVALFARRFKPAECVPLDGGDRLYFNSPETADSPKTVPGHGARVLTPQGQVQPLEARR